MGSYNSQYENYYASLVNTQRRTNNKGELFIFDKERILKRFIRELTRVLILFILALLCKVIVTPYTKYAYNYSKNMVNTTTDYRKIINKAKGINIQELQQSIITWIDEIKSKIQGGQTIKETMKSSLIFNNKGTITSTFGKRKDPFTGKDEVHKGIDIALKEDTDVFSCGDGKVKEIGEDKQLGKYIIINHGKGIETKYGHLNQIIIKKDDKVTAKTIIGKSGNTGKSTAPHLHLEVMYMGESKNPEEFLTISN